MPTADQYDARGELLTALMRKVEDDTYPSSTMLDMIESLLTPEDVESYAEVLLDRIRADQYPSTSMIQRVQGLA